MWNLSQIFIGSGISGFSRIWSVCRSGRCKNAKFEQNFHRECIFLILPNFGLKMWNLSQIFIGCGISGFSRISSVCRSGRSKNAKFEKNFHRECIFWILPDFGGKNVKFEPNFHRQVEFLDFAGFQVFAGQWGARMRNSSRIFIASAFSGFCPMLGAKMWNLSRIFIGSGISGFSRISSVYRSVRCKNA